MPVVPYLLHVSKITSMQPGGSFALFATIGGPFSNRPPNFLVLPVATRSTPPCPLAAIIALMVPPSPPSVPPTPSSAAPSLVSCTDGEHAGPFPAYEYPITSRAAAPSASRRGGSQNCWHLQLVPLADTPSVGSTPRASPIRLKHF
jgi:hypothetical protein